MYFKAQKHHKNVLLSLQQVLPWSLQSAGNGQKYVLTYQMIYEKSPVDAPMMRSVKDKNK